jgi:hypothetical protein
MATIDDFWACRTKPRRYVYIPTGDTWIAAIVNSQTKQPVKDEAGRKVRPTAWLDKHRPEPESSRAARAAQAAEAARRFSRLNQHYSRPRELTKRRRANG